MENESDHTDCAFELPYYYEVKQKTEEAYTFVFVKNEEGMPLTYMESLADLFVVAQQYGLPNRAVPDAAIFINDLKEQMKDAKVSISHLYTFNLSTGLPMKLEADINVVQEAPEKMTQKIHTTLEFILKSN